MNLTAKKRSLRRHFLAMKKAKYRYVVKDIWLEKDLAGNPKFIGRMVQTPHPCSGFCCGNPRRKWKGKEVRTLQERIADEERSNVA